MICIYYLIIFGLAKLSGMSSEAMAYSIGKNYYNHISQFTDLRPQINCNTHDVPFMDNIVRELDRTTKIQPTDTLLSSMHSSCLYVNFYPLDMDNYTYDENEPSNIPCEIDPDGSYYITIGMGNYTTGNIYGFEYNGIRFVTWRYLRNFFTTIKNIDLYKPIIVDDDLDDYGDFCDWRFVVIRGKIKIAVCYSGDRENAYDLLARKEISTGEFFNNLPTPLHELNNPSYCNNSFKFYY